MNSLQAFVGHSFNESDRTVVRAFLDFLDVVSDALPSFSWKHAQRPEPKIVTEKVLELLDDVNVFIGICTRKEQVVAEGGPKATLFYKDRYVVLAKDLQWKASDWVIQEIGLAIGRGLKTILLLENGVRLPGSLQGDLEYISFDRSAPERAFNALLLMLTDRAQSMVTSIEASPSVGIVSPEESASIALQADAETPNQNWKQDDFEFALLRSVVLDRPAVTEIIDLSYRATTLMLEADNAVCWNAYKLYLRLRFSKGGDLSSLREMAQDHPTSARIQNWIGTIYKEYEEFDEAAEWFERAASVSSNVMDNLQHLQRVSSARMLSGNIYEASLVIERMKDIALAQGVGEQFVLKASLDVAPKIGGDEVAAASLERLLELDPANTDTRFSLAYKYSEMGLKELSLLHYSRIHAVDRTPIAWNNLGVAWEGLGMPAKGVEAYREAERQGETLAMSNLAYRFIKAGFLKEAEDLCDTAVRIVDHHKNVDEALGRLKQVPAEEISKESSMLERARKASAFYREVGKAMATNPVPLSKEWRGPDCDLALEMSGGQFTLRGTYCKVERGLAQLVISKDASRERTYVLEYTGTMIGRAFFGTVVRKGDVDIAHSIFTALGSAPTKVLMWVDVDATRIQILEFSSGEDMNELTLTAM